MKRVCYSKNRALQSNSCETHNYSILRSAICIILVPLKGSRLLLLFYLLYLRKDIWKRERGLKLIKSCRSFYKYLVRLCLYRILAVWLVVNDNLNTLDKNYIRAALLIYLT